MGYKTKKCIICGAEFKPKTGTQITCSISCREEREKYYKEKRKFLEQKQNRVRESRKEIERLKSKSHLVENNRIARKNGMSYGEYMAQEYLRKQGAQSER